MSCNMYVPYKKKRSDKYNAFQRSFNEQYVRQLTAKNHNRCMNKNFYTINGKRLLRRILMSEEILNLNHISYTLCTMNGSSVPNNQRKRGKYAFVIF